MKAPTLSTPPAARTRILEAARTRLFAYGYSAFLMDELACDLGMSKKTLYVHFPGKDAIVGAIIDEIGQAIRSQMDVVLANPRLNFAQKLSGVIDVVGSNLAKTSPGMLHDLQRFAPQLHQKIDDVRRRNVPYVFGRLIRAGLAEGKVRPEFDPDFAVEYWLQAIRGMVQPEVLERTGLTPRQTLEKAIHLYFSGLLSSAGHKDYEKALASRPQPAAV
ncbi:MAG TPA: TetR/AcrR family transcriptional regulator [Opitutaceae bacterium]|nr:TetR/AcrR family transcriptional regulator [Opitutaceae bacterium]